MDQVLTLCPECLRKIKEVKSTVQCPKYNHSSVCLEHCFKKCRYLEQSISLQRCTYREVKQKEKEAGYKKSGLH